MDLATLAARDFALLSGGEKQRVMIARALVQKPDLLILDEPTNHLDIQLEVLALLASLPTTVIVSLHDLALASAHADRVLVLDRGRQVQLGAPLDVLTPRTSARPSPSRWPSTVTRRPGDRAFPSISTPPTEGLSMRLSSILAVATALFATGPPPPASQSR